jgi:hypothetical protein
MFLPGLYCCWLLCYDSLKLGYQIGALRYVLFTSKKGGSQKEP